ncbi:type IV pilus secretin PilQ [Orbaceae bacterium ac157xtp]
MIKQTNKIGLKSLAIFFYIFLSVSYAEEKEGKISLNFTGAQTELILQALADHKKLNLIIEDHIEHQQTVRLNEIDWDRALNIVTKPLNLQVTIEDNLLIIRKPIDKQKKAEEKMVEQKMAELQQPLIYKSFSIHYADIKPLMTTIQNQGLLSQRGKIFIDERTNSLIVNDIATKIEQITPLLQNIDKPLPQIHIEAKIVNMSSESIDELGIKWGYSGTSSQIVNSLDLNFGVANPTTQIGFNIAKHSGNILNLELSALEAENQLEIIASPNLTTTHLNTASIKQGTEIPYEVSNGSNGATSIEFKQAVLGLEVTPKILKNGQIELNLYITQNAAGRSIKRSDGGEALAIDTQEIKTQVLVKDGETLILGGIFQQIRNHDQRSVPGVSKIPLIGNLFKYDGKKIQKRELVIFIKPKLIL